MTKYSKHFAVALVATSALVACSDEEVKNETTEATDATENAAFPKTVVDGRGVEVVIEEQPARIVSTALAVDEYLVDLVDDERIVGVTSIATDPSISNVADKVDGIEAKFETVTAEQIIALEPDLVIVPSYVNPEMLSQVESADIDVYQVIDDSSFDGIANTVTSLGELLGEEDKAAEVVENYESRIAAIEEKAATVEEPARVLYYTEYLSSVTNNTTIGEMIDLAGGVNVVDEAGIVGDDYPDYPNVSKELVVDVNPEIIFTTAWVEGGGEPTFVTEWKNDPALANVEAIKNDAIYVLDSANVTTASHYVVEGAEDMLDILAK